MDGRAPLRIRLRAVGQGEYKIVPLPLQYAARNGSNTQDISGWRSAWTPAALSTFQALLSTTQGLVGANDAKGIERKVIVDGGRDRFLKDVRRLYEAGDKEQYNALLLLADQLCPGSIKMCTDRGVGHFFVEIDAGKLTDDDIGQLLPMIGRTGEAKKEQDACEGEKQV